MKKIISEIKIAYAFIRAFRNHVATYPDYKWVTWVYYSFKTKKSLERFIDENSAFPTRTGSSAINTKSSFGRMRK